VITVLPRSERWLRAVLLYLSAACLAGWIVQVLRSWLSWWSLVPALGVALVLGFVLGPWCGGASAFWFRRPVPSDGRPAVIVTVSHDGRIELRHHSCLTHAQVPDFVTCALQMSREGLS
jgi:hypothetical protein